MLLLVRVWVFSTLRLSAEKGKTGELVVESVPDKNSANGLGFSTEVGEGGEDRGEEDRDVAGESARLVVERREDEVGGERRRGKCEDS